MGAQAIAEMEQLCRKILSAIAVEDWRLVSALDRKRIRLLDQVASTTQTMSAETPARDFSHVLKLDRQIQRQIQTAWQKAHDNLLSIRRNQSAIDMYHRQEALR